MQDFLTRHGLTQAEARVTECIIKGQTNKQAAESLFLSIKTVKFHLTKVFRKLNVKNRTQLVITCLALMGQEPIKLAQGLYNDDL